MSATALSDIGSGSDKPISIAVLDSAGSAMSPTSATWSLYDQDGNIVNSRSGVAIAVVSSTFTVPVAAADNVYNALPNVSTCRRFLKVDIIYTNSYVTAGHLVSWWQWDITKCP
jgi:hypothetical protein